MVLVVKEGNMRSLIWAAGLSLILAAGLDSSALAENTRIPLRPGLTLDAVDGKVQEYFQQILDSELDPEAKKKWLAGYPRDGLETFAYYIGTGVFLRLMADGSGLDHLKISYLPERRFTFIITLGSRRSSDGKYNKEEPVEVNLQIDGKPVLYDSWEEIRAAFGSGDYVAIYPHSYLSSGAQNDGSLEFLRALINGRKLTIDAVLKTGEPVSLSFDLAGLAEAVELLKQKREEVNRIAEREIQENKKQLEALN